MPFYIYYIAPHKLCLYEISRSHSSDYRNYSLLGLSPCSVADRYQHLQKPAPHPEQGGILFLEMLTPQTKLQHITSCNRTEPEPCLSTFVPHTHCGKDRQLNKHVQWCLTHNSSPHNYTHMWEVKGSDLNSTTDYVSVSGHLNLSMQMLLPLPSTFSDSVHGI